MYRCHVGPCGLLGLLGLLIRPTPGCVNHVANRHQNPVFSHKTGFWCHNMTYSKLWKCRMLAPISSLVYSEPDFGAKIWHMSYIGIIFQTIIRPHIGSSPISIWVPKIWVLEVEKKFLLHIWWFFKVD